MKLIERVTEERITVLEKQKNELHGYVKKFMTEKSVIEVLKVFGIRVREKVLNRQVIPDPEF